MDKKYKEWDWDIIGIFLSIGIFIIAGWINHLQIEALYRSTISAQFVSKNDVITGSICPVLESGLATGTHPIFAQAYGASLYLRHIVFATQKDYENEIFKAKDCESYSQLVGTSTMDIANKNIVGNLGSSKTLDLIQGFLFTLLIISQILNYRRRNP